MQHVADHEEVARKALQRCVEVVKGVVRPPSEIASTLKTEAVPAVERRQPPLGQEVDLATQAQEVRPVEGAGVVTAARHNRQLSLPS